MATIRNSTVLITGGTGSFGNRVATRIVERKPQAVVIFSRDEKKQWEMRRDFPDFQYIIGDVRDYDRVWQAMEGIDIVFHASALKQVPSCESVPMEAVKTNILGVDNVCRAAIQRGVQIVIALSTDKAVKPVNAMGISKAMMEKIVCAQNQRPGATVFCCVRYGNVMGSRGSVIPLFEDQVRKGGPVTITHPEMTRFLLTLDDSVSLVFYAIENATGGEIFVKKAPACTVDLLADAIISRHGGDPRSIQKVVTGIRPGEKIHEVLVNEHEMPRSAELDDYFIIRPELQGVMNTNGRPPGYEYTSANAQQLESKEQVIELLEKMGKVEFYT